MCLRRLFPHSTFLLLLVLSSGCTRSCQEHKTPEVVSTLLPSPESKGLTPGEKAEHHLTMAVQPRQTQTPIQSKTGRSKANPNANQPNLKELAPKLSLPDATIDISKAVSPGNAPKNLVLDHNNGLRNFKVSWSAGHNNDGFGGCKLQYLKNSTTWIDLKRMYNCDEDANGFEAEFPDNDGWTSNFGVSGVQVRLVRSRDHVFMGVFEEMANCISIPASRDPTPNIDEDCNGKWDNQSFSTCQVEPNTLFFNAEYQCLPCNEGVFENITFVLERSILYFDDPECSSRGVGCTTSSPSSTLRKISGLVPKQASPTALCNPSQYKIDLTSNACQQYANDTWIKVENGTNSWSKGSICQFKFPSYH
jgi:hypothetical protein